MDPARRRALAITASRVLLALLGAWIGLSAWEHWSAGTALRRHYAATLFGEPGVWLIAVLQSLAAVALLVPRTQVAGGFALGAVLLVASATHGWAGESLTSFWSTPALAAAAIVPAAVLARLRRSASPPAAEAAGQ